MESEVRSPQIDAAGVPSDVNALREMGLNAGAGVSVDRVLAGSLDFGQGTALTIGKQSSPFRGIVYGNDAMYGANFVGNLLTSAIDKSAVTSTGINQRVVAADVAHNFGAVKASLGLINGTQKIDGQPDQQSGNGVELTGVYKQDALSQPEDNDGSCFARSWN